MVRRSLMQDRELVTTFNRAWPLIEAADLVGDPVDSPRLPAPLRPLADPSSRSALPAAPGRPGLDGLRPAHPRRRPPAARRPGGRGRSNAASGPPSRLERETHRPRRRPPCLDTDDDGEGLITMFHNQDMRDAPGRRERRPRPSNPNVLGRAVRARRRGRGPGTHRRRVADAAAPLPVAELHHRGRPGPGPGHGFTETWQERLERIGIDRVTLAQLSVKLPDPGRDHGRGRAGDPGPRCPTPTCRPRSAREACRSGTDRSPSSRRSSTGGAATGIAAVIGDPTFLPTRRVRSLTPELSKGLEFDLVRAGRPGQVRRGGSKERSIGTSP